MTSEDVLAMAKRTIKNRIRARIWDVLRLMLMIFTFGWFLYLALYMDESKIAFAFSLFGVVTSAAGVYFGISLIYSHKSLVKASRELVNWYDEQEKKAKALLDDLNRGA